MTEAATTQSLDEINAAIADLQAKAAEVRKHEREAAISKCITLIAEFEIAAAELAFKEARAKKQRKAKEAKAPTHRGPNGELWTESNQGRKPNWITALIAGGGDLEQYRIARV